MWTRFEEAMSPLQLSIYWRLSLLWFFGSFNFFIDIFATAAVAATCHLGNATVNGSLLLKNNQSWHVEGQANWTMESVKHDSVCSWTELLPYGQTLFMVGMLLGSLIGGVVSDRYGKRPTLLLFVLLASLSGLVPAALPLPHLFLAIRCLMGVCSCCAYICAFSLAVEWTLPSARLWPPAILPFCFSLGMMCSALLAWLSPSVRWLHLSLALPQVVSFPLFLSVPESPSWLLIRRRLHVLDRYHSNSPADKQHLDLLLDSAWSDLQRDRETQGDPLPGGPASSDLVHLRQPTILLRLFIMAYLGAVTALTYFGICMNIGSFGVNVYAAQFFSGLSEAPCLLVPLVRLGRRPISMLTLFLSGTACFLSLLLSRNEVEPALVMSLALLGKLCILAAVFIFVLYSIELFPTVVRQRCLSTVNLCFRVGSLVNYLINSNGEISLAAMAVYSSGPIIGCGLCLLLPETSGIPLPDLVEDCDKQPLPPISCILCRTRMMASSQSSKPEITPAEKADPHTEDTHTGLL